MVDSTSHTFGADSGVFGEARGAGRNVNFDDLIVRPDFLGAEVPESVAKAVRGGD